MVPELPVRELPRCDARRGAGAGFSLLELVLVIAIISVLATAALYRLWPLQAEAEQVAMEQVVGSLRSALGIKVAEFLVRQDLTGLRSLEGSNPMDRLSEVPGNYRGEFDAAGPGTPEIAIWYFDRSSRALVYRARNADRFQGGRAGQAEARFAVRLYYRESVSGRNRQAAEVAGAQLAAVEPYRWLNIDFQPESVPAQ